MMWLSEVSTASLVPDSAELLKLPHPSSRPLNPDIKGYSMFRISNFELILEQQYNKECFDRELSGTALLQTQNRNQNRQLESLVYYGRDVYENKVCTVCRIWIEGMVEKESCSEIGK